MGRKQNTYLHIHYDGNQTIVVGTRTNPARQYVNLIIFVGVMGL